jgi:hypothetical protein
MLSKFILDLIVRSRTPSRVWRSVEVHVALCAQYRLASKWEMTEFEKLS